MNGPDTQQQQTAETPDTGASKPKHVERLTVSKRFRAIAKKCLPGLDLDPAHWQFFGYLLFGSSFDEVSGKLLIGQPKIAKVLGEDANNFVAGDYLERFQREVMPAGSFEVRRYSKNAKKCRQVNRCEWPAELAEAIPHEIAKDWHKEGRVYLDGSAYSDEKKALARKADYEEARMFLGIGSDARMIQRYMNERKPHLFTDVVKRHYADAQAVAKTLRKKRSHDAQMRMLRRISDQEQPYYSASFDGNTVRLFAADHIPNLQSDVRRALVPEWAEADLKYAQLAICARNWNVTLVQDLLRSGVDFWQYLSDQMQVPAIHFKEAKRVLKPEVYAMCFGQLPRVAQANVTKGLKQIGMEKAGKQFIGNEAIAALLSAAEHEMRKIERAEGALDCDGNIIFLNNGRIPRQILAQVAQSWEMKLIAPIFRLAEYTTDFQVMLYQFDGVSIHFGKKDREAAWRQKITEAVNIEANTYDIHTELEWKN